MVVFPGASGDTDAIRAVLDVTGESCDAIWHHDTDLCGYDAIIIPGGASFGDYLRSGALAAKSPVMRAVKDFAAGGGLVLGICNGFQVLIESGLLPGVLFPNNVMEFRCQWVGVKVENNESPFTMLYERGQVLRMPIAHGQGNYYAAPEVIRDLEDSGRVVFRYVDEDGNATEEANPNGALNNIAGIINAEGNVMGLMPHPERCVDMLVGGDHGKNLFLSIVESMAKKGRCTHVRRKQI